ncbi:hypothetical protein BDD12DRAFT_899830 [Trichophaea hybrida]|nr:hypothetical protein BDD12DRAFT_899830 [Trichophaea hybrida]
MISFVSNAENIDPTLLQSSSSASASPSAMYPPINVSNSEPAPPNTNAAPRTAPSSSTATTVPPPPRPSAPTTLPPPSRPTTPKQRLTQSNFPFPTSTVPNSGTKTTLVKRAKRLYKDRPRICMVLRISKDDHAVINDYRDWIENGCIRRGKPLNVPNTPRMDTENYELARSVTNKWNRHLDNVRNAATKAKKRMTNGKRASPFDNEDVYPASSVSKKPKTSSANHTPLLTPTLANAAPTNATAVATPTTPVAAPPSVLTPPPNNSGTPLPVIATPPVTSPPPVVTTSLVVATPPAVSLPPVVATPLVVATSAIGNSTPGTTPEGGQVIGMIQGRLPFAEDDILMISTNRATTFWRALNLEVWVRVRDDNDTAKVYCKVAGPEEWQSVTEDEEEFQIDPNATLVCPTVAN